MSQTTENPMKKISLEKVVLNMGLGISVTLTRPGYGIRTRSKHKASVGKKHIISADEAKDYLVKEFGVTVV